MAKGKGGGNRAPAPAPAPSRSAVAVVNQRGNSNTGVTTRTVTPVNGATQRQANQAVAKGAAQKQQPKSIGQAIRAAGSDGNLSRKEALKISNKFDVSGTKVVSRLDAVNDKLSSKRMGPIGLGSAAANSYAKGELNNRRDALWSSVGNSVFGTSNYGKKLGPIQGALNQMIGSRTPMVKGQGGTTVKAPLVPKGQQIYGSYNGTPQLRIKPSWDNMFSSTPKTQPAPAPTATGTTADTGMEQLPLDYIPEELPKEELPPPEMPGMMSGGGAGINSAMGIRRKKSSWKSAGISTKGTSNMNRGLTINSFNV
jgi:hypothetical protein